MIVAAGACYPLQFFGERYLGLGLEPMLTITGAVDIVLVALKCVLALFVVHADISATAEQLKES